MTHTITQPETISVDRQDDSRRVSIRIKLLAGVAVAVVALFAALDGTDQPAATGTATPQDASQLRWEGLAAAAGSDLTDADRLRWERLAEHVQSQVERSQAAHIARWEGLAEHVQSRVERSQAAHVARWEGLAEHLRGR